jgi:hypothetical protein
MEGAYATAHVALYPRRTRHLVLFRHRHVIQEGEITRAHGIVDRGVEQTDYLLILRARVRTRRLWDLYRHGQEKRGPPKDTEEHGSQEQDRSLPRLASRVQVVD